MYMYIVFTCLNIIMSLLSNLELYYFSLFCNDSTFFSAPKVIIYDNACSLHQYCLNRDPEFFKNTEFYIDRLHWDNHVGNVYNPNRIKLILCAIFCIWFCLLFQLDYQYLKLHVFIKWLTSVNVFIVLLILEMINFIRKSLLIYHVGMLYLAQCRCWVLYWFYFQDAPLVIACHLTQNGTIWIAK